MMPSSAAAQGAAARQGRPDQIGFVPDPMILRTGRVFLNGARGTHVLERSDFDVWEALQQNIGGLLDFFDMVVTREVIPLINYGDTFDRMKIIAPLLTGSCPMAFAPSKSTMRSTTPSEGSAVRSLQRSILLLLPGSAISPWSFVRGGLAPGRPVLITPDDSKYLSGDGLSRTAQLRREILELRQAISHREYGFGVVHVDPGYEGERWDRGRIDVDQAEAADHRSSK